MKQFMLNKKELLVGITLPLIGLFLALWNPAAWSILPSQVSRPGILYIGPFSDTAQVNTSPPQTVEASRWKAISSTSTAAITAKSIAPPTASAIKTATPEKQFAMIYQTGKVSTQPPKSQAKPVAPSSPSTLSSSLQKSTLLDWFYKGQLDPVRQNLHKQLESKALNASLWALLGELEIQAKQYEASIQAYKMAHRYAAKNVTYSLRLAQLFIQTQQKSAAIELLAPVFQTQKQHKTLTYMLGTLYAEEGQYQKALPLLRVAAPHSLNAKHNLAYVYHQLGEEELAVATLKQTRN